jgi:hypothetical protein
MPSDQNREGQNKTTRLVTQTDTVMYAAHLDGSGGVFQKHKLVAH